MMNKRGVRDQGAGNEGRAEKAEEKEKARLKIDPITILNGYPII
ncbi:MAG TPA: hypothetical protein VK469_14785 [Candidatus Kapabacteria bacterium]|nr:hypothetical protein [Candidatus Kapabacteria bacterium]